MIQPAVSVVIPNYNHAKYLRQRIDSVLNQRFRNFEIIILDDASTDGSRDIIAAYKSDPRVTQVLFNTVNSGSPFLQWKRGVELARGEWIWIAESDDYADEHFIEALMSKAEGHPEVGLLYCDSNILEGDKIVGTFAAIKNKNFNTPRWSSEYYNNGIDEIEKYLLKEGTINNTSAVLFRKSVLLSANPFDIPLRYMGDKYAFMKVLAKSDIGYVPQCLNYYRDPFNTKHEGKYLHYFHEHFLMFHWVLSNLKISNKKFSEAFYENIRSSVYRSWNKTKFKIYREIFLLNPGLFMKSFFYNLLAPLRKK